MNPWISHVKHYAKQHNVSYKEALKKAKSSYRPVKGGSLKSANDWYWQKNKDLFNQHGIEIVISSHDFIFKCRDIRETNKFFIKNRN